MKLKNKQKVNVQKKSLISIVEEKFLQQNASLSLELNNIKTGDILRIGYKIPEGEKERIQFYEGLVIAQQNRSLSKTLTLRRSVQGIGIEQIFLINSPKIVSITKKQSSKVRRSKLYFMRYLKGKATRLKVDR